MNEFNGFPSRMEYTPVPNIFLSNLLPGIIDIAEIKVILQIFRLVYFKKGNPKFVTFNELSNDVSLLSGLQESGRKSETVLKEALESAIRRMIILRVTLDDGNKEDVYLLNTEANREAVEKIKNREIQLSGLAKGHISPEINVEKQPDIFTLYEENIGLLTPMIAEELRDAEKVYPELWIKDAIKEAVNAGKRNWRYISSILEHWTAEGRSNGAHLRNFKKTDPDKFIKGRYGHAVKR